MIQKNNNNSPVINIIINNGECQEKDETATLIPFMGSAQNTNRHIKKCFCEYLEGRAEKEKASRVKDCANSITFRHYKDLGIKTLDSINLCRERLCLNCCVALARKNCKILNDVFEKTKKHLYFITLTVKNVQGRDLRRTVQIMGQSFSAFVRAEHMGNFYRSTEITYNEKTDTYHPHIHFITDKRCSRSYLNNAWAKWFNKKAGTNYKWLSCKIEPVRDNFSIACELNKYITKPLNVSDNTIDIFYNQLKGLRLHGSGGEMKKRVAECKSKAEAEKLNTDEFLSRYDYDIIRYIYDGSNYICEN